MLFKNGKLVISGGVKEYDLRVEGEKIAEVGPELKVRGGEEVIDLKNRYLMPGVIDSHTHFSLKARGDVSDDDPYAGGISALFGGVTTVIDYADYLPGKSLQASIETREREFTECPLDYHFHLVLNENFPEEYLSGLQKLREIGITSLKLFTTYPEAGYMLEEKMWPAILQECKKNNLLVTVHAEDNSIVEEKKKIHQKDGLLEYAYHPRIRPASAEAKAVEWLIEKVEETRCPLYIVHVSTEEASRLIAGARERGLPVLGETAPHYLLLLEEMYKAPEAGRYIMTPPLRSCDDQKQLWFDLANGNLDVVATDHCAFFLEKKLSAPNVLEVPPGIPGVETMLPLIYTYGVQRGRFSLERMVQVLCENPAQIFGLYPQKGTLKPGADADLVVYDPAPYREISEKELHSRAGYSPFAGMEIFGRVDLTVLRGEIVISGDRFLGKKGNGKFIPGERGGK